MPFLLALLLALCVLGCSQQGAEAPPNIIIVCMDTLRRDRLGIYGNTKGLTPNIDRFAAEAVVFEDAYAVSNETLYSHAALFTSRYATETGPIFDSFRLADTFPTLAEVLGVYGYRSAAFVGGGHMGEAFAIGRGFDSYVTSADWGSLYHSVPDALRWLDQQPQDDPSLLFVHGYDTHHRYLKPGPYGLAYVDSTYRGPGEQAARGHRGTVLVADGFYFPHLSARQLLDFQALRIRGEIERRRIARLAHDGSKATRPFTEQDHAFVRGVYDGAVSYGDAWFGLFLAALERRGALEDSVVVLLSDHGEELGEDGLYHHRYTLSDTTLRVPLIVRLPGGEGGGQRVSGLMDLTDVMPTLLEAAGATAPAGIRGRSLWSVLQGQAHAPRPAVFAQTMFRGVGIRTPEGRLSFSGIGADSPFLEDMIRSSVIDGRAFDASKHLDDDQRLTLRDQLAAWASELHQPIPTGPTELSEEQLRVMQDKGYWGAQ